MTATGGNNRVSGTAALLVPTGVVLAMRWSAITRHTGVAWIQGGIIDEAPRWAGRQLDCKGKGAGFRCYQLQGLGPAEWLGGWWSSHLARVGVVPIAVLGSFRLEPCM